MGNKPTQQIDKFKQAARDLECDDDDQVFRDRLGKIAKAVPVEKPAKSKQ